MIDKTNQFKVFYEKCATLVTLLGNVLWQSVPYLSSSDFKCSAANSG